MPCNYSKIKKIKKKSKKYSRKISMDIKEYFEIDRKEALKLKPRI